MGKKVEMGWGESGERAVMRDKVEGQWGMDYPPVQVS